MGTQGGIFTAGTFNGGTATIDNNGSFTLNGADFTVMVTESRLFSQNRFEYKNEYRTPF